MLRSYFIYLVIKYIYIFSLIFRQRGRAKTNIHYIYLYIIHLYININIFKRHREGRPRPLENHNWEWLLSCTRSRMVGLAWLVAKRKLFFQPFKKIENVFSTEVPGKGLFFHIGGTSTRWCDRHIKLHRKAQNSLQRSSILKHFARVTRIGLEKKHPLTLYFSIDYVIFVNKCKES